PVRRCRSQRHRRPRGVSCWPCSTRPLYLEFFHFIQAWRRIEAPLNAARTARSALSLPNPNGIRPHSPELPTRAAGVALAANGLKKSRPLGSGLFKRQREQGRLPFLG